MLQKFFQDYVLNEVIHSLNYDYINIIWEKFDFKTIPLFSEDKEYLDNLIDLVKKFTSTEFWRKFLKTYLNTLLEEREWKKITLWEILINWKKEKIKVDNDKWKLIYELWNFSIDEENFFDLIWDKNKVKVLQWNFHLLFIMLKWNLQIWSERWFREILSKTIDSFVKENPNYENIKWLLDIKEKLIDWLKLVDDYIPEKDFYHNFPAWTDNTNPPDLFLMLLMWKNFIKQEFDRVLNDYLSKNSWIIDKNLFLKYFIINLLESEIKKLNNSNFKISLDNLEISTIRENYLWKIKTYLLELNKDTKNEYISQNFLNIAKTILDYYNNYNKNL